MKAVFWMLVACALPAQTISDWTYEGPDHLLHYRTDSRGNSIMDFSSPGRSTTHLPLNKDAEEKRAASVEQQFGKVAPGIVQYTTDVQFRDLWLRPDLAPRDRSLATVTVRIASGQAAQPPRAVAVQVGRS